MALVLLSGSYINVPLFQGYVLLNPCDEKWSPLISSRLENVQLAFSHVTSILLCYMLESIKRLICAVIDLYDAI